MKQKDVIYLLLAVVILLVAGYVVYSNIMPKSTTATGVTVDKIGVIAAQMDPTALAQLNDKTKTKDFSSPIEFSGLGNTTPFGK